MSQFLDQGVWHVGSDFPSGRYRFSCRPRKYTYVAVTINDRKGDYVNSYDLDYDEGHTSCIVDLKSGYSVEIVGDKVKMTPY